MNQLCWTNRQHVALKTPCFVIYCRDISLLFMYKMHRALWGFEMYIWELSAAIFNVYCLSALFFCFGDVFIKCIWLIRAQVNIWGSKNLPGLPCNMASIVKLYWFNFAAYGQFVIIERIFSVGYSKIWSLSLPKSKCNFHSDSLNYNLRLGVGSLSLQRFSKQNFCKVFVGLWSADPYFCQF